MSVARLVARSGLGPGPAFRRSLLSRPLPSIRYNSTAQSSAPPPPLPPPPPPQSEADKIRRNGKIAAAVLALAAVTAIYEYSSPTSSSSSTSTDGRPPAPTGEFTINMRLPSGNTPFTFTHITREAAEKLLHEHEESISFKRAGNPVIRVERNTLASNDPSEDRMASDLVPRSTGASFDPAGKVREDPVVRVQPQLQPQGQGGPGHAQVGKNDLVLVSVFDGHSGGDTSTLLTKALHPTITIALAALQAGQSPLISGKGNSWAAWLNPFGKSSDGSWTPENVARALQKAVSPDAEVVTRTKLNARFTDLDNHICFDPIRRLAALRANPSSAESAALYPLLLPAMSGACAISAVVDSSSDGLYVASTGDCRAVAGWQTDDGKWRCDVLTEDQMGDNPNEVARMRGEHPGEPDVIKHGRVLGALQPTRAFGDAKYKWTNEQSREVNKFMQENGVTTRERAGKVTPPYVTAQPDVAYRKIHSDKGEKLKFVILATDGLWDAMTSEEATLLVASYMSRQQTHSSSTASTSGDPSTLSRIRKAQLPQDIPLLPPREPRPYPAQDLPGTGNAWQRFGAWTFEDTNAATHLIRNSLAGADEDARIKLLSLKKPVSRMRRDDVSVQVIFFGDD